MTGSFGARITRRMLLRTSTALSAIVAAGGGSLRGAFSAKQVTIYYLDPNCAGKPDVCSHPTDKRNKHGCNACYACINHANNKRWASEDAITRAHECCRCSVKRSRVPAAAFEAMFGTGGNFTPAFDLRNS